MSNSPALPKGSEFASLWSLDPGTVYLNHGSFGACPREVLAEQDRLRGLMERDAVRFFVELLPGLTDEARRAMASFVNCPAEDVVFVPNATTAVATVLEHLAARLQPGDEILATAHEYPACMNNLRRIAQERQARVVTAPTPFPLQDPAQAENAIMQAVTPRTRAALLSLVTSPSALILPLFNIVPQLEERGIATIVDGAHGVGFAPIVDLSLLKPSFFTSNCHKWLCTPKGSAFLYVRRDHQEGFRPLVLSNNAEKPKEGRKHLWTEFDYVGTADPTAHLAIPRAIEYLGSLVAGGWSEIMQRNHELAMRARALLCERLGTAPAAPESMIGPMATIWLPPHTPEQQARLAERPSRYHDALQDALLLRHRIQVPIWSVPGETRRFIRISAQLYNSFDQYEYLAGALARELAEEQRL